MMYLIVEPRMLIVSREMVSLDAPGFVLFFVVILTARKAVFICGETEVIVPLIMVPFFSSIVTDSLAHFIRNLYKPRQHLAESMSVRDCADSSETNLCIWNGLLT